MKHFLLIVLASVAVSCSSDTGSGSCPDGQVANPVTGVCQDPGSNNANNQNNENNANNQNNANNENNANNANNQNNTNIADAGRDANTAEDMAPDATVVVEDLIRFVAIGDQGEGNADQYTVGQSIGVVCTALGGCDFGMLLGDNFYDSGVDSANDSMWMTHFAMPYGHLPFPFYAVLGNHDLGGDGLGIDLDFEKGDYQVQYSQLNPKWIMPAKHYAFEMGPGFFIGLNTTDIFFNQDDDQYTNVPQFLAQGANSPWKIAFGHHPYYSNGRHGNAGEYEGLPFIPIANGEHVKDFMEDNICGKVDFYLCGHDHNRQDLVPDCQGTQFIVSGAGAKTTELEGDNPTHFQAETEGFLLMELTASKAKIQFYDLNGTLEHTREVIR